jgi:uncharacterized membrane protein
LLPRSTPALLALLSVLAGFCSDAGLCRESRRDPSTSRIRILYFGDAFAGPSPYPIFANDPLTTILPIRASGFHDPTEVIRRHMRTYMPRTEAGLSSGFDMIILSDANIQSFRTEYFNWFRNAVIDSGLGLVMIGGLETFGAVPNYPGSWGETAVADVLPVLCLPEQWESREGRLEINQPANAFISSLPFDELGPLGIFFGCNIVGVREGVSPLAYYSVLSKALGHPLLCFWDVGNGSSYAMTADWTPAGGTNFLRWGHYGDYALNLAIYATGGKIPEDPSMVYEARRLMDNYRNQRQTLESTIEFVSKFGANMGPVESMLGEAYLTRSKADRDYLNGEIDECIQGEREALEILDSAFRKAYELRDEALLWVYLTEWLVVASTGMVCGFILWTIMVRRRLYREVGETKLLPV